MSICDADGAPLIEGAAPVETGRIPIRVRGFVHGWVQGTAAADAAGLLAHLVEQELALTGLRDETLGRYRELTLLFRLADALPQQDAASVAEAALREASTFLGAEQVDLWMLDGGVAVRAAVHGGGPLATDDALSQLVRTERTARLVDPSGDERCAVDAGTLMVVPLGGAAEVLGVLRAWTPRASAWTAGHVKLVRALASHAGALLHVAQLREEAERASRAKSAFLARLSHELRGPLGAVIGYAEMLQEDLAPAAPERQDVERILQASQFLLELASDVLHLSHVETDRMELNVQPVDLRELIEAVVHVARPAAEARGNVLTAAIDPMLPTLHTDPLRLRQVLQNLVGNACKFTEDGTVTVRVVLLPQEVAITVQDTGIGMTPGQLARIFDPFTQADATISGKFGGSGLGLAIAQRLVLLLGGEIEVDSAHGEGTQFRVSLPLPTEEWEEEPRLRVVGA